MNTSPNSRVAVVTGGARGIGRAIGQWFLRHDCRVVLLDCDGATLDYTSTQGLVIRNPNRPAAPNIEGLIGDDDLSAHVRQLVADEVNPALAAHGGFVTYVGHDGDGDWLDESE